jgi:hypothetical protein
MKIHILYDRTGNIKAVGMASKESKINKGLIASKGQSTSDIDTKVIDKFDLEGASKILKRYKVETGSDKPNLVAKAGK